MVRDYYKFKVVVISSLLMILVACEQEPFKITGRIYKEDQYGNNLQLDPMPIVNIGFWYDKGNLMEFNTKSIAKIIDGKGKIVSLHGWARVNKDGTFVLIPDLKEAPKENIFIGISYLNADNQATVFLDDNGKKPLMIEYKDGMKSINLGRMKIVVKYL